MPSRLSPAPNTVDDGAGAPRFGSYEGALESVDLSQLTGRFRPKRLERLGKHKKWLYGFVSTQEVAAVWAIVDLGYVSNAFALAVDLIQGRVLVDESYLGPPRPLVHVGNRPAVGLEATFLRPDALLRAARPFGAERFHGHVRLGPQVPLLRPGLNVQWELLAAGGAPPLTVIAPVEGGFINVTQKWMGLLSFGSLEAGGRKFSLDGGLGGLDYTQGYLARATAWRWAAVCGRLEDGTPLGLNLVEGFNESRGDVNENALWLGSSLIPLSRARFRWNRGDSLDTWHVTTVDGEVDIRLRPLAVHREKRDLLVVRSRFEQPVGLWSGTVTVDGRVHVIKDAPGVAEDQDVLW